MDAPVDPFRISQELVRSLRGDRTQVEASRCLGFTSNVFYTWESGRRAPEMSRVFRLAELSGVPAVSRLLTFLTEPSEALCAARLSTPRGVQYLVEELMGGAAQSHVAERIGVDRTTLARWLQGKTEPRLPDLLALVQTTTQRLLPFVACFADPSELPSTRVAWSDLQAQARLAYELPFSHAILRALELDAYASLPQHDDDFLATRLGLDGSEVRRYLQSLAHARQISWTGSHWTLARVMTVDTRQDPDGNRALKLHWATTSTERLRSGKHSPDALFSYNLFAVSNATFEAIRELHLNYYDAVRALVDESPGADQVVLLNAQLLPLGEAASGPSATGSSRNSAVE